MKRLILTRHAKSSWSGAGIPDNERPLNARGRAAAPGIGAWLADKGYLPDQVLCSTARRCTQTWEHMAPGLGGDTKVEETEKLYLAGAGDMLELLRSAHEDCVLMIGHMPGIGAFVRSLRRDPPPLHASFAKYPTGATTVLDFRIAAWPEVDFGLGILVDQVKPRDLG